MKLVERRWLSWTIRAVLYIPLVGIFAFVISVPYVNEQSNRRQRQEVEQRYHELVAAGKLEQPSEGFSSVQIVSRHGGPPFSVWFWRDDSKRGTFRYFVVRRKSPEGPIVWQFQDTKTKQEIY